MNHPTHVYRAVACLASALLCLAPLALVGCAREKLVATTTYVAPLEPLNPSVAGEAFSGEARFTITGDQLVITVKASGVPAGIEHWQHVHGFADGRVAACPTMEADANGDGLVDVIETEPIAGITMIPLNGDPVRMDVTDATYPVASSTGSLSYTKTVSLAALEQAFAKAFPGQRLSLERRVVFLHGVPASTSLPATVASLGTIPAHVTLPIACGVVVPEK